MSVLIFLTVVQAIVAIALVGVILMQRSEGGGLGVGGSPTGLMSARGAADFLTRMTAILASIFVVLSIVLAALAVSNSEGRKLDTTLDRTVPVSAASNPAIPVDPLSAVNGAGPAAPAGTVPILPAAPAADPLQAPAKK